MLGLGTVFVAGTLLFLHTALGGPPAAQGAAFAYMRADAGGPVGYDPCLPIQVYVNDELQPWRARGLVEDAVEEVAEASGLDISFAGSTTESATADSAGLRARLGGGAPVVLVAWTTPEVVPKLTGTVIGLGGSIASSAPGDPRLRYVAGRVVLDTPQLKDVISLLGNGRAEARAVIMHELGHVLGLTHVDDPRSLMHPTNYLVTEFSPGDLQGLKNLGSIPCR